MKVSCVGLGRVGLGDTEQVFSSSREVARPDARSRGQTRGREVRREVARPDARSRGQTRGREAQAATQKKS